MSALPEVPELQLDAPREEVLQQAARLIVAGWSSFDAARHGQEVRPRIAAVRRVELIGSVGPRTLVWLVTEDGEQTVELMWRSHDGRLQIEGARTFTPGSA